MIFPDATVYVVDDDSLACRDLSESLIQKGLSVRTFATVANFIDFRRADKTACLILDLHLPDFRGLELQRTLLESGGPPVIFTTEYGDVQTIVRAVRNGALDFLSKPVNVDRLFAAIERAFLVDTKRRCDRMKEASLITRWTSLTPREAEVFKYVVIGYLNKQAASELGITENTCQIHRGRVMRKMGAESFADLVRMAIKLEKLLLRSDHATRVDHPQETPALAMHA